MEKIKEKVEKVALPDEVRNAMNLWRNPYLGGGNIPECYIDFHRQLATKAIEKIKELGFTIHRVFEERDGWFDGMMIVAVIVESKHYRLSKIVWSDSNQWFMLADPCGAKICLSHTLESIEN